MNGLEALYDIAVTCDSCGFEPTVPCEFDNVKNHHFAYLFKKQFAIIEKELKALNLIKEKQYLIIRFNDWRNLEELRPEGRKIYYYVQCPYGEDGCTSITEHEYDVLSAGGLTDER